MEGFSVPEKERGGSIVVLGKEGEKGDCILAVSEDKNSWFHSQSLGWSEK